MERTPEPELMDGPEQARAYALADFKEPNSRFLQLFQQFYPNFQPEKIIDLGCGPAEITIRFARLFPASRVEGVDGAPRMLEYGLKAVAARGLADRVRLRQSLLPGVELPRADYDAVVSNSLLHHLAEPLALWRTILQAGRPEAAVLVMDLQRPASRTEAEALVQQYAADEPLVLQEDFFRSLLAAYRPVEVRQQLLAAGLGHFRVEQVSDRHLAVHGRLPKAAGG